MSAIEARIAAALGQHYAVSFGVCLCGWKTTRTRIGESWRPEFDAHQASVVAALPNIAIVPTTSVEYAPCWQNEHGVHPLNSTTTWRKGAEDDVERLRADDPEIFLGEHYRTPWVAARAAGRPSMSATKCKYMDAAYPTLDAEDCCEQMHRHEPRVFDLAKAMAEIFQATDPSDEKIGWFLDDADAVVDDFTPTPESWDVEGLPGEGDRPDIARRLRINGVEYVIQESEWEPAHPVSRATYDSWQEDAR